MEVIMIGKPAVNVYLPLQEFPQEGDIFTIKGKNESLGNISAISAVLFAKWGVKPHYTGVVGNDAYAEKIRNTFALYKVNTKYMEVAYNYGTAINYQILNVKTGKVTKILYNDPSVELTKYKYDFLPDYAVLDGSDMSGTLALLNNDSKVKTIFYARRGDKDTVSLAKRCTWVICTQTFAEVMTKYSPDGSTEDYVNLYQHIVDTAGNSNYIVLLNNHNVLYSEAGKVKMLPEMKINSVDESSFDSVFVGSYAFAYMKGLDLDNSIKFAQTAAAISLSKIGEEPSIPTLDEVLDNSGLRDKVKVESAQSTVIPAEPPAPMQTPAPTPVQSVPNAFSQTPVQSTNVVKQTPVVQSAPGNNTPAQSVPISNTPVQSTQVAPTAPVTPPKQESNIFDNV